MGRSGAGKAADDHQSVGINGQLMGACAFLEARCLKPGWDAPFRCVFRFEVRNMGAGGGSEGGAGCPVDAFTPVSG
jgi:hypothetical protein